MESNLNLNEMSNSWNSIANDIEKSIKLYPEGKVDMLENAIRASNHKCGTVHCFAGWWGAINLHQLLVGTPSEYISFGRAAHLIANMLGFTNHEQLSIWCDDNPALWGNNQGYHLFYSCSAFGVPYNELLTRQHIVSYLRGVAARCEQAYFNGLAKD